MDVLNWSLLRDVYGPAGDVPALLDAGASDTSWDGPVWSELWERLYHQGSVAPASYAAVPALCDIARARPEVATDPALFLAAAILASTEGPLDRPTVRARHAADIDALRPIARHKLELVSDPTGFIYALQNVAIFEDLGVWQHVLDGLANQEVELDCPACGDHVYLELTGEGLVASLFSDDLDASMRLEPASSTDLETPEATLFALAGTYGQQQVQDQLLQVFGHFKCPACNQRVRTLDAPA